MMVIMFILDSPTPAQHWRSITGDNKTVKNKKKIAKITTIFIY